MRSSNEKTARPEAGEQSRQTDTTTPREPRPQTAEAAPALRWPITDWASL